jgi:hypothetical protein
VGKFQNRIVGHEEVAPDQLLAHPDNFRIHSSAQQELTRKAMAEVGWVDDVTVNKTTGRVIDGHMRIALAMRQDEPTVPVKYVELTEQEERFVLRTLDPLGELAGADAEKLKDLHDQLVNDGGSLEYLRTLWDVSGVEGGLAFLDDGGASEFAPVGEDEQGRLDEPAPKMVRCPHCGERYDLRDHE